LSQHLLPIKEIGVLDVRMAEEATDEERKRRLEAGKTAGVGIRPVDTRHHRRASAKFGTLPSITSMSIRRPSCSGNSAKYIGVEFFHACWSRSPAEHAARMTAMDSHQQCVQTMIDSLTLVMNRARQAQDHEGNYRDRERRSMRSRAASWYLAHQSAPAKCQMLMC